MALIEHDLFRGQIDRVQIAIDRLKIFEPPEGYYLAYSGGKDSDTILALAKMAGVKFDAHYHLTTVDPPELVYHVRRHPEVQIEKPNITMWQLIKKKGMLPTRVSRFCCAYFKERGGAGRLVMTGVRGGESHRRSKRKMNEFCYKDKTKSYFHPIIDWSDKDVWEFLKSYNIPYCKLYDPPYNMKRIGCVMCPLSNNVLKEINLFPKIAEAYKRATVRAWDEKKHFTSGEDMFNWWISGRSVKEWAEKDTEFWAYE